MKPSFFIFMTAMLLSTLSYSQAKTAPAGASAPAGRPREGYGLPQPAIGDMAPDFLQYDTNGKPVRLSDFKGKWVLLDFWGPFCVPCRKQNPHLGQMYEKYKDKNFTILSVSVNYGAVTRQQWLDAIAHDKMVWPNVTDPENLDTKKLTKNNMARVKFGVAGLPRNFLIDPSGKIVAMDLQGDPLEEKLREVVR